MAGLNIQGAIDSAANNAIETMQVKNLLAERYEQFGRKQRQTRKEIIKNTNSALNKYTAAADSGIISPEKQKQVESETNKAAEQAVEQTKTPKVKSIKDYVNQKQRLIDTENTMNAIQTNMMVDKPDPLDSIADQNLMIDDMANGLTIGIGENTRNYLNPDYVDARLRGFQRTDDMARKMMADQRAQEEAADKIKRKSQAKVKIPTGNPTERGMNFD